MEKDKVKKALKAPHLLQLLRIPRSRCHGGQAPFQQAKRRPSLLACGAWGFRLFRDLGFGPLDPYFRVLGFEIWAVGF